jgi:hypothetical protein
MSPFRTATSQRGRRSVARDRPGSKVSCGDRQGDGVSVWHDAVPSGNRGGFVDRLKRARDILEIMSFIAVVIGAPTLYFEMREHRRDDAEAARQERITMAAQADRAVCERYADVMRSCIDHPRLDCYSEPPREAVDPPFSPEERMQQKLLYSSLTDAFETAYIAYHPDDPDPEVQRLFDRQWRGWDASIRRFLQRPAYRETWFEIREGYDPDFVARYMDHVAPPEGKKD